MASYKVHSAVVQQPLDIKGKSTDRYIEYVNNEKKERKTTNTPHYRLNASYCVRYQSNRKRAS